LYNSIKIYFLPVIIITNETVERRGFLIQGGRG